MAFIVIIGEDESRRQYIKWRPRVASESARVSRDESYHVQSYNLKITTSCILADILTNLQLNVAEIESSASLSTRSMRRVFVIQTKPVDTGLIHAVPRVFGILSVGETARGFRSSCCIVAMRTTGESCSRNHSRIQKDQPQLKQNT
jgi:hypothetical protein